MDAPQSTGPTADRSYGDSRLESLTSDECMALLATQPVARLGVLVGEYPVVIPVAISLDHGVVVLRSGARSTLTAAQHANVTVQADQIDPVTRTGWSVLVRGLAEEITEQHSAAVVERSHRAAADPWAPGGRQHWVRVIPHRVTGRRLVGKGPAEV